jgi:hypothetical protein
MSLLNFVVNGLIIDDADDDDDIIMRIYYNIIIQLALFDRVMLKKVKK